MCIQVFEAWKLAKKEVEIFMGLGRMKFDEKHGWNADINQIKLMNMSKILLTEKS